MGAPSGTWKFYNAKGQAVGEGTYQNGKRWMGTFIGSQIPGADFFLTKYPMKMEEFDSGILINEKDFLEELGEQ